MSGMTYATRVLWPFLTRDAMSGNTGAYRPMNRALTQGFESAIERPRKHESSARKNSHTISGEPQNAKLDHPSHGFQIGRAHV